jgi:hypothetical protein
MNQKPYLQCLPFFIIGLYMVATGAISKTLISESDVPATQEDRDQFKATTARRALVILGGLVCIAYSFFCARH